MGNGVGEDSKNYSGPFPGTDVLEAPTIYIYPYISPMCYMSRIFQQIYTIDPNFYGYIDNINNIHIYIIFNII